MRGWGDTLRKRKGPKKENYGPRLALRNRYLMTVKNDALRYFLLDFPLILITELPRIFYMAIFAPHVLMGLKDLVLGLKPALNKRKLIRKRRIINDTTMRSWFKPQRIKSKLSG